MWTQIVEIYLYNKWIKSIYIKMIQHCIMRIIQHALSIIINIFLYTKWIDLIKLSTKKTISYISNVLGNHKEPSSKRQRFQIGSTNQWLTLMSHRMQNVVIWIFGEQNAPVQTDRVLPFKIKESDVAKDRSFHDWMLCFRSFIPERSKIFKWVYLHSKHQKIKGKCQKKKKRWKRKWTHCIIQKTYPPK